MLKLSPKYLDGWMVFRVRYTRWIGSLRNRRAQQTAAPTVFWNPRKLASYNLEEIA